ncbi:anti-sigma factor domain-containing protein [Novosphingobium sp. 9]|uniref:anti-sigma factor n=1 Tax=Novosphingobium sp. 9 TaxID=2025349 RepID=UPI0021B53787|nr:anti-sigma factor [Novosphingobium sp. 9]
MTTPLSDDDELLAAEMAFRLIDGEDLRAAEARLGSDAEFAAAHARWQAHACAMLSGSGEAPRPSVWSAIEARLPANDVTPKAPGNTSLRWWQAATLMAGSAAVVLAVVALRKPESVIVQVPVAQQAAASAPMVAVLTGEKGVVTVSFDPASGRMTSAATGLEVKGHSPELWVIPADGKPRSMGVFDPSAPDWAKVPTGASAAMAAGATLAVSVEPLGGSPTGQPTGPVILTGKLVAT